MILKILTKNGDGKVFLRDTRISLTMSPAKDYIRLYDVALHYNLMVNKRYLQDPATYFIVQADSVYLSAMETILGLRFKRLTLPLDACLALDATYLFRSRVIYVYSIYSPNNGSNYAISIISNT